jgi:calcineurin-like phosphoesterase family protein
MPACGLRVDVGFDGPVSGRIDGSMRGVDYLQIRADRRIELHVHGELTADDATKVAVQVEGVGMRQPSGRSVLQDT